MSRAMQWRRMNRILMWWRRRKIKLTDREIARIVKETIDDLPPEGRQAKTDFLIQALESREKLGNADSQACLTLRAELYRLGVRHSKQL